MDSGKKKGHRMRTAALIPCLPALVLSVVLSCGGTAKFENDTARFKDYKNVEDSLTMVMSFPSKSFAALYEKFRQDYGWNGDISTLEDGVYESYSTVDLRGYVHYVRFTVANGAFTSVYYDEFIPGETSGKKNDKKYGASVSKRNPDILTNAYARLETNLMSTKNPLAVDTVSGATLASYRFQIAILKAVYEASSRHVLNTETYSEGPGLMNSAAKEATHD